MTIHELYKKIYQIEEVDSYALAGFMSRRYRLYKDDELVDPFVALYEPQKQVIDNALINLNTAIQYKAMHMTADYVLILVRDLKEHAKALPMISKVIEWIETYPDYSKEDLLTNQFYADLIYARVICNDRLGKPIEAAIDANKLLSKFPNDSRYEHLLSEVYEHPYIEYIKLIWIFFFGTGMACLFFGSAYYGGTLSPDPADTPLMITLECLTAVLLVLSLIGAVVVRKRKRKIDEALAINGKNLS